MASLCKPDAESDANSKQGTPMAVLQYQCTISVRCLSQKHLFLRMVCMFKNLVKDFRLGFPFKFCKLIKLKQATDAQHAMLLTASCWTVMSSPSSRSTAMTDRPWAHASQ